MTLRLAIPFALGQLLWCASVNAFLEDVTDQCGISFRHTNGGFVDSRQMPSRWMPESLGSGVAIFDLDADGDNDILLINSSGFDGVRGSHGGYLALYKNLGDWRFIDVAGDMGLDLSLYGMGVAVADFDGDWDPDLLISTLNGLHLFELDKGRYHDVSEKTAVRVAGPKESGLGWTTGVGFFDADNDSDLDIMAIRYLDWSPENDVFVTYDSEHKVYASPRAYAGLHPLLLRQTNGKYADVSGEAGIAVPGKSLGLAFWDFDDDRLLDVVIANDTTENFLFRNLGGGRFENIALQASVAFDADGDARAGMGIDIADLMNDGRAAIAIGNFSGEPTSVFQQYDLWHFQERSRETGVRAETLADLTFGLVFLDLDLDGWQDMVATNGHVEPTVSDTFLEQTFQQPLRCLKNNGSGRFLPWLQETTALSNPMVGRGLAYGDLDNDGDLDMVVTGNNQRPRFIRNNRVSNHYLRVHLRGLPPNTDAIGARILLHDENRTQQRFVRTGGSYLSQSELTQTFGFSRIPQRRILQILWPDGSSQIETHLCVDCVISIRQKNQ